MARWWSTTWSVMPTKDQRDTTSLSGLGVRTTLSFNTTKLMARVDSETARASIPIGIAVILLSPRSGVKRLGHAKGGLVRASLMQALERAPHGFWRDLRLGTAGSKSGQFCSSRSISRMHLKQPALWRYDRPE